MVYQWLQNVQLLAYPARCVLCDAPGQGEHNLCRGCEFELPFQTRACRLCALTLPESQTAALCPACQQKPALFNAAWSLLRYETPVDWLVTQLKFHARLSHAKLLAQLMADRMPALVGDSQPQALLPVPLHRSRWRERGFNQATEIARPLGRMLGLPTLGPQCARRVVATAHQADLAAKARKANVRNAFRVASDLNLDHVAIVDDVVTTGATATALARALKKQGVKRVDLWCAARA